MTGSRLPGVERNVVLVNDFRIRIACHLHEATIWTIRNIEREGVELLVLIVEQMVNDRLITEFKRCFEIR